MSEGSSPCPERVTFKDSCFFPVVPYRFVAREHAHEHAHEHARECRAFPNVTGTAQGSSLLLLKTTEGKQGGGGSHVRSHDQP